MGTNPVPNKKLAIFTATGCRACENAILDIHYQVSSLAHCADIAFWPYVSGSQWKDLEEQAPMDVCFFSGAIRTGADREAAIKLREKSRIMVACGACASFGGMPGLMNMPEGSGTRGQSQGTTDNGQQTREEGKPELPPLEPRVSALSQIVKADYVVPGCPPTQNFLWAAIQSLVCNGQSPARLSFADARLPEAIGRSITSGILPPQGSVFAGEKAVCASCSRVKEEKRFEAYKRPYQDYEASGRCLLEQGLVCQGITTREGCGGLCTALGQPCRGCFGKAEAVFDPGAKMVSAISSTFDSEDATEIGALADDFVDLVGTFYRYTLPTQCTLLSTPSKD
jgi:F420-non-reducing hydrogenase small subunit